MGALTLWNVLPTINGVGVLECLSLIITFQQAIDAGTKNYLAVRSSANLFIAQSAIPVTIDVTGALGCRLTRHSASQTNFLMLLFSETCVVRAGATWTLVFSQNILVHTPLAANTVYVSVLATGNTAMTGTNTNSFTATDMTPFALAMLTSTSSVEAASASLLAIAAANVPAAVAPAANTAEVRTAEDAAANEALSRATAAAAADAYQNFMTADATSAASGSSSYSPLVFLSLLAIPVLAAPLALMWWKRRRDTMDIIEVDMDLDKPEEPAQPKKSSTPGTPAAEIRVPVMPSPKNAGDSPRSSPAKKKSELWY